MSQLQSPNLETTSSYEIDVDFLIYISKPSSKQTLSLAKKNGFTLMIAFHMKIIENM